MNILKIKEILANANLKCDDNINHHTLLIYLNQGITRLNIECNLKLPSVLAVDVADAVYEVSNEDYVNNMVSNILCSFIAYCIRQNEGYTNNDNTFFGEYLSLKMNLEQKFLQLIKDEYQLNDFENGSVKYGRKKRSKLLTATRLY